MSASPETEAQGYVLGLVWRKTPIMALVLAAWLLAGCQPVTLTAFGSCDYDYSRLMEAGWTLYKQFPLAANDPAEDETPQCIVLFHVNSPRPNSERQGFPDPSPQMVPVMGAVYRQDRDRSRSIHQHELHLPYDMHLGERNVTPRLHDALSKQPGQELVVEDKDADQVVVQASIWKWNEGKNSEASSYQPLGWFSGTAGIKIEKDKVSTFDWLPDSRAKLAWRQVYKANDGKDFFFMANGKPDMDRTKDPDTRELVVMVMPPDDRLAISEYPEVLVMAYYERLLITNTARFDPLMDRTVQVTSRAALGCLVDTGLQQVFVQNVDISKSPGIPAHIENTNYVQTDTVTVTSQCLFKPAGKARAPETSKIEWLVRWDWNVKTREAKWQIIKATAR